jgi:hypothetical protein
MMPLPHIAPTLKSPARPPPAVVGEATPPTAAGTDEFRQRAMRRTSGRRNAQHRPPRLKRRLAAPPPVPELPDSAPFLAQLLAQDTPEEPHADPFETAARAYGKVEEDPFKGLDGETLDAVLADPRPHVDVKI